MTQLKPAEKVFRSDCGGYFCRWVRSGNYEAWSSDGTTHWRDDDRIKTWADWDRRRHPLKHCVGGFSAERYDQKEGSFTLDLLTCDTRKYIKPWTGNTVIETLKIVFRRRVPAQNVPRFIKEVQCPS